MNETQEGSNVAKKKDAPAPAPTVPVKPLSGAALVLSIVDKIGAEAKAADVRKVLADQHPDRVGEFGEDKNGIAKLSNYVSTAKKKLGLLGEGATRTRTSRTATPSLFNGAPAYDPVDLIRQVQALSGIGLTAEQVSAVAKLVQAFGADKVTEMVAMLGGK